MKLKAYNSVRELNTSDHLPVYAIFENKVKFNVDIGKDVPIVEYGGSVSEVCTIQ